MYRLLVNRWIRREQFRIRPAVAVVIDPLDIQIARPVVIPIAVAIDLKPLTAGNYTVEWQVLSVDTHITEGTLHFTFSPGGK